MPAIDPIAPSGQISESHTVTDQAITLDFVPAPDSVAIAGFVRMYEGSPTAGQFKVTPGSAEVEFNAADEDEELDITYTAASAPGVTEDKVNEIIDEVNLLAGDAPDAVLTTKGDIMGFDTAAARIPVGSDGQVLTADSGQALGVKWDTPATPSSLVSSTEAHLFTAVAAGAPHTYNFALNNAIPTGTLVWATVRDSVSGNIVYYVPIKSGGNLSGNIDITITGPGGSQVDLAVSTAGSANLTEGSDYVLQLSSLHIP